jgi:hypothetical protein
LSGARAVQFFNLVVPICGRDRSGAVPAVQRPANAGPTYSSPNKTGIRAWTDLPGFDFAAELM